MVLTVSQFFLYPLQRVVNVGVSAYPSIQEIVGGETESLVCHFQTKCGIEHTFKNSFSIHHL